MERLSTFIRLMQGLAIAISLYVIKYIEAYLSSKSVGTFFIIALSFLVIIVMIKAFEYFCSVFINNSRILRRIILGSHYIEGVWINSIEIEGSKYCGILMISTVNNNVYVSGEQFDHEGDLKATWSTELSKFDGNTLRYVFQARHTSSNKIEEIIGFSTFDFSRPSIGKVPLTYHGYLVDFAREFERNTFSGFKLTDRKKLKLLKTVKGKKELAIEFLNAENS